MKKGISEHLYHITDKPNVVFLREPMCPDLRIELLLRQSLRQRDCKNDLLEDEISE